MSDEKTATAETLEREFASAITRVYTVTATALIAGIILTVIISQQMREHEARVDVIGREAKKFRRHEAALSHQLRNSAVRHTTSAEGPANARLSKFTPPLPERVAATPEARKERLGEIEKLLARADKIVDDARAVVVAAEAAAEKAEKAAAEKAKVAAEKARAAAEKAAKKRGRKPELVAMLRREPMRPPKDPDVVAAESAFREAARKLEYLQFYRAQLAQYQTTYAEASTLAARIEAHAEEVKRLRESKQSLPTPFGQFDVSPRFGLIGVLVGLIGAYLYSVSVATKARRIATIYCTQNVDGAITRGLPAPDWLATLRGADLSRTFGWYGNHDSRRFRSAAIHVVWVALFAFLSIEIYRWNAWEDVLLAPRAIVVILTGLAVLTGVAATAAFLTDTTDALYNKLPFNGSRRRFIAVTGTATGAALALLFVQLRHWPKRKQHPVPRTTVAELGDFDRAMLVVNEKTRGLVHRKKPGVVHHLDVCSGHLRRRAETVPIEGDDVLHTQCRVAILTALTKEKENLGGDTQSLAMLALGIAPISIHLYDALMRNDERGMGDHARTRATITSAINGARDALAVASATHEKSPTKKTIKSVQQSALLLSQLEQRFTKMQLNALPKKLRGIWIVPAGSSFPRNMA